MISISRKSGLQVGPALWSGVAFIGLSGAMAIVYLRFEQLTQDWPTSSHMAFRVMVVGVFLFGVYQTWIAFWEGRDGGRRASRFGADRLSIPREGVVYLVMMIVMLMGALLGRSNLLMLVFALMVGPFIINGWTAFTMLRGCRLSRRTPRRAMAGETFSVEFQLANRWRWLTAWMMRAEDRISGPGEALRARVLFARVEPGQEQLAAYQLALSKRGRYQFGPGEVTSQFPMGLIARSRTFPETASMLIYPRIGRLNPRAFRIDQMATELVVQPQSRSGLFNDEFHHLREYRPGDNPRSIHWRSSAKRNALIVREFHQNREHDLAVLIDLWDGPAAPIDQPERVELALSIAATLCRDQTQRSRESTLHIACAGSEAWERKCPATTPGLEVVLDYLATATAGPALQAGALLQAILASVSTTTRLVVVTTRRDLSRVEWLTDLQGALGGRLTLLSADPADSARWITYDDEPGSAVSNPRGDRTPPASNEPTTTPSTPRPASTKVVP